jgi:hypothetical protein
MNFSDNENKDIHSYIESRLEKYDVYDRYGWVSFLDNNKCYVAVCYDCRPHQFQFGQLNTMSSIYDTIGKGWSKMTDKKSMSSFGRL